MTLMISAWILVSIVTCLLIARDVSVYRTIDWFMRYRQDIIMQLPDEKLMMYGHWDKWTPEQWVKYIEGNNA